MTSAALKAIREIATTTTRYSHTLRFTRRFTAGTLEGLTHEDSIGFCSLLDCEEWVSSVNRQNKAGKLDYFVESWRVETAA